MTDTEDTKIHTDLLGQRYRLGDGGRREYIREDCSEYEYHHQLANRRAARYAEAIIAAEAHGYERTSIFTPPGLEGELLLDSTDDALGAAADMVDFVAEALGDHTQTASGWSPGAEHGVSLVLELAADQVRRVLAYREAQNGLALQQRQACGAYIGLQRVEGGAK